MTIPAWWRHLQGLAALSDEEAERAICRAAAEITGLTPEVAQEAINGLGHGFEDEALILRRFAELAEEK
jgi:hypothetical protein